MANLNISLFRFINSFAGSNVSLDKAMIFAAQYLIYTVPLFLLALWIMGNDKKKKEALLVFLSVLASLTLAWLITKFYYHPRPFVVGLGKELIKHAADSSFPSDHATFIFAVAFALLLIKEYWESLIFFALFLAVGFARVYCGIHFPYDILGAIPISMLGAFASFMLRNTLFSLFSGLIRFYNNILKRLSNLFVSK
ncbi:undecaprenyl-diphosphatase [Caldisericum sp.]|jgi:undecaprenyl-diphosphatase|uniref:undecaprenyl-diphosphatase n=1 Tax=Caldisericum sp. TaxID=2499687 RepID=UPI003D0FC8FF